MNDFLIMKTRVFSIAGVVSNLTLLSLYVEQRVNVQS
jgi:hypothetical protein